MDTILHIGTEKTGTTTIQAFLAANRRALLARGLAFTSSMGAENDRDLATYAIRDEEFNEDALIALDIRDREAKRQLRTSIEQRLAAELAALRDIADRVIFSSEHLQSRLKSPAEIATLHQLLRRQGLNVTRVIVYLRDPAQIIWSMYSTALRNGSTAPPPVAPTNAHWRNIADHRKTLSIWGQEFGRDALLPRIFEPSSFVGGTLLADFAHSIDLDLAGLTIPAARNRALTVAGQALMRGLNERLGGKATDPSITRAKLVRIVSELFSGTPPPVLEDLRRSCEIEFAESNEWVRSQWFPERGSLFRTDEPSGTRPIPGEPTVDDALDVLARYLTEERDTDRDQTPAQPSGPGMFPSIRPERPSVIVPGLMATSIARAEPDDGALLRFSDVVVAPFTELLQRPQGMSDHRGGPAWPDWESQTSARHNRHGQPADALPEPVEPESDDDGPLAWAGPVVRHFGHQLADFSMRIVPTLAEWPDATMVVASHPRYHFADAGALTPWVVEAWAWLGLPRERVRFVARPTLVRQLMVAPQAEQLGVQPSPDHLDRMDAITERWLGSPARAGVLYVSRAGQGSRYAGERYIESMLTSLGVRVIRPEDHGLREQLHAYATAATVTFAEGSAIHGVQLLGRALGEIHVLTRRAGSRIAAEALVPRATSVAYHDVAPHVVHGTTPSGEPNLARGIGVLDPGILVETLEQIVPGSRSRFDPHAFERVVEEDLVGWFRWIIDVAPHVRLPERVGALLATLDAAGHRGLRPAIEPLLRT
jgi:hypothetical protein